MASLTSFFFLNSNLQRTIVPLLTQEESLSIISLLNLLLFFFNNGSLLNSWGDFSYIRELSGLHLKLGEKVGYIFAITS